MRSSSGVKVLCVVAVLLTVSVVCLATSGSTWHVTVENPTQLTVMVNVGYSKEAVVLKWVEATNVTIPPGGQHRFDVPGAACPFGVAGVFIGDGKQLKMKDTNCLGNPTPTGAWTACCWNVTFEVCRKEGEQYGNYRDGDFGFCKK